MVAYCDKYFKLEETYYFYDNQAEKWTKFICDQQPPTEYRRCRDYSDERVSARRCESCMVVSGLIW